MQIDEGRPRRHPREDHSKCSRASRDLWTPHFRNLGNHLNPAPASRPILPSNPPSRHLFPPCLDAQRHGHHHRSHHLGPQAQEDHPSRGGIYLQMDSTVQEARRPWRLYCANNDKPPSSAHHSQHARSAIGSLNCTLSYLQHSIPVKA